MPLTGWLARRFGAQRIFITCYLGFAVVSLLCGLSSSLGMLLGMRVLLGLVGGPIMPLSQMLLLRIFPKEKATLATVIWAMTTLIGPVAGPILGGIICDNYGWAWIFFIKVPIAAAGGLVLLMLMRGQPDPKARPSSTRSALRCSSSGSARCRSCSTRAATTTGSTRPRSACSAIVAADRLRRLPDLGADREEPDRRPQDLPPPRLRRRGDDLLGRASAPSSPASSSCRSGCSPTWATPRPGPATRPASWASSRCCRSPLVGKAVEKFDPRLIVCVGILGLGRDHGLAHVDVHAGRHLPADGLADAAHRPVHGHVLRAGDRPRHGQRRATTSRPTPPASPTSCGRWPAPSRPRSSRAAGRTRRAHNNTEIANAMVHGQAGGRRDDRAGRSARIGEGAAFARSSKARA